MLGAVLKEDRGVVNFWLRADSRDKMCYLSAWTRSWCAFILAASPPHQARADMLGNQYSARDARAMRCIASLHLPTVSLMFHADCAESAEMAALLNFTTQVRAQGAAALLQVRKAKAILLQRWVYAIQWNGLASVQ